MKKETTNKARLKKELLDFESNDRFKVLDAIGLDNLCVAERDEWLSLSNKLFGTTQEPEYAETVLLLEEEFYEFDFHYNLNNLRNRIKKEDPIERALREEKELHNKHCGSIDELGQFEDARHAEVMESIQRECFRRFGHENIRAGSTCRICGFVHART